MVMYDNHIDLNNRNESVHNYSIHYHITPSGAEIYQHGLVTYSAHHCDLLTLADTTFK